MTDPHSPQVHLFFICGDLSNYDEKSPNIKEILIGRVCHKIWF